MLTIIGKLKIFFLKSKGHLNAFFKRWETVHTALVPASRAPPGAPPGALGSEGAGTRAPGLAGTPPALALQLACSSSLSPPQTLPEPSLATTGGSSASWLSKCHEASAPVEWDCIPDTLKFGERRNRKKGSRFPASQEANYPQLRACLLRGLPRPMRIPGGDHFATLERADRSGPGGQLLGQEEDFVQPRVSGS